MDRCSLYPEIRITCRQRRDVRLACLSPSGASYVFPRDSSRQLHDTVPFPECLCCRRRVRIPPLPQMPLALRCPRDPARFSACRAQSSTVPFLAASASLALQKHLMGCRWSALSAGWFAAAGRTRFVINHLRWE